MKSYARLAPLLGPPLAISVRNICKQFAFSPSMPNVSRIEMQTYVEQKDVKRKQGLCEVDENA